MTELHLPKRIHAGRDFAVMLARSRPQLALAVLIFPKAAVNAIFAEIGGLDIPAKIAAINARLRLAVAANHAALQFLCHRFAHFVEAGRKQPCRTAPGRATWPTCGLALHLIAEHGNRRQIRPQGQLVAGKQRAGGNAKIALASPALESGARPLRGEIRRRPRPPHSGQTAAPSVSGQRTLRKVASASSSDMRKTDASVSVLAFEERRKCWAKVSVSVL